MSTKIIFGIIAILVIIVFTTTLLLQKREASVVDTSIDANSKKISNPIKIGFIAPLTGDLGNLSQNAQVAVKIAVREINETGGIDGRNIEVIYEDSQCDGKLSIAAAKKLIEIDDVSFILGDLCSPGLIAMAETVNTLKVPAMSFCASAPSVTNTGDFVFRNYPSDVFQATFAAKYLYNNLGYRNAVVVYLQNDWGEGLYNAFNRDFTDLGGKILLSEGFQLSARDFKTTLTKIKAANPDVIYFPGFTEASIMAIKQAGELGINIPMFGADAWDDPEIWSNVGVVGDKAMYTKVAAKLSNEFKNKMKNETDKDDILTCTPTAYDGLKLIARVMEKVGVDPVDIKNELYKISYTEGVSSDKIEFDENGDVKSANYSVMQVSDGVAKEL